MIDEGRRSLCLSEMTEISVLLDEITGGASVLKVLIIEEDESVSVV